MQIAIAPPGTRFTIGAGTVMLTDTNCIWDATDTLYFTPEGWRDHQARKEYLPKSIDQMRQNPNAPTTHPEDTHTAPV